MKTTKQNTDAFIASLMPDSDKKMVRIAGASLLVAFLLASGLLRMKALSTRSCLIHRKKNK